MNPADPWGERKAQNKADAQAAWRYGVRWFAPCVLLGLVGTALSHGASGSAGSSGSRRSAATTEILVAPTTVVPSEPAGTATATTTKARGAPDGDPSRLAADLQGLLTRFSAYSYVTRTAPGIYTDTKIVDDLQGVASLSAIVDGIIPYWAAAKAERTSILPGPGGVLRVDLTGLTATTPDRISASFCFFDDAIVVAGPMGTVVRDEPRMRHGQLEFSFEDDHWEIARYSVTSEIVLAPGASNPCTAEALVPPG